MVALALGRWPADLTAFAVLLVVALARLVPPEQAFAGFGSPAVAAVAAIFVLSTGLERTGAVALLARPLRLVSGRSYRRLLALLMGLTGLLAGFMNNLAAMGVLLPVTMTVAHRRRLTPTRLLLPLAYAARFGGNLTLIAGPSNVLIAAILQERGLAHLGLFDFVPLGLTMLAVGTAWTVAVGWRLLPARPPEELLRATRRRTRLVRLYRLSERLFEARIPAGSPLAGKTIEQSEFGRAYGLTIVAVVRDGRQLLAPPKDLALRAGDRLVIEGRLDELLEAEALERLGLELAARAEGSGAPEVALDGGDVGIVEAMLSPRSSLVGRTLREINLRDRSGLTVLALWREGRPIRTRLADLPLQVGDGLLLQGPWRAIHALRSDPDFIVLEAELPAEPRPQKLAYALAALGVMIVLALAGVPIALAAAAAAGVIVLTGAITPEEAYRAIHWRSIVLIGGMVPLGLALERTGAARLVAEALLAVVGRTPPAALAGLLAAAVVVGHFMDSVALTLLMAPIALDLAATLGVSPVPFAMAVLAATGLTLLTPFSNAVMLMVMAPGGYRLRDYVRSGLPLVGLLALAVLAVIPLAYPF